MIKIVFFGGFEGFSDIYLDALKKAGFEIVSEAKGADLGVIAYYGKIIPKNILELPKHGFLNAHPSLLPSWRGPSPVQAAILAGDKITGVTIHIATEEPDAGPILAQKEILMDITDTCLSLTGKLAREGAELLIPTIKKWLSGEITPKKQDDSKATYTGLLKKKDGEIDWSKPADYIERRVRAYAPWPGTFTKMKNGKILKIKKTEVINGILKILIVQPEGKQDMPWEAFLRGHKDAIEITSPLR
ncbi:MAG: methionyl-tRNA formyltransferase [Candidatus Giovannonibacteria bacterium]|nr:methionyl-tRNA formyltransferase [Candidatus Giovannonibacteria bacterium]